MRAMNEVNLTNRPPRLLVVDDQPVNIQALYQAFSADHQVLMATNGEQALKLAISKQPDLVLLDVMMPGMDGHEVCQRLKADESTRDIPVIFVTAHDDEASETLGLEMGAVDFISKPINPKIVRARVKTHLTLKAQSDLLRHWVYIDGLTGVYNRRHFDERLATEWARALRNGTELSVVLLDVDFFKRYNDRYGHQAGDDCLRRLATCLRDSLKRPADLVARYGGEEFVCLLPETPLSGAMTVAGLLRDNVAAMGIEHADSAADSVVTVSLGVCCKPAGPLGSAGSLLRGAAHSICSKPAEYTGSAASLLSGADAQLYQAKAQGRARACGALLEGP